jgi:hypothetical protein
MTSSLSSRQKHVSHQPGSTESGKFGRWALAPSRWRFARFPVRYSLLSPATPFLAVKYLILKNLQLDSMRKDSRSGGATELDRSFVLLSYSSSLVRKSTLQSTCYPPCGWLDSNQCLRGMALTSLARGNIGRVEEVGLTFAKVDRGKRRAKRAVLSI